MKNTTIKFLLFLLFLSATNSHAVGMTGIGKGEGIPIEIKEASITTGLGKSDAIDASINGHSLTVIFLENLGTVHIEVTDTNGGAVALTDLYTPNGYNAYIYNTGSYIVTFTLTNGDEYYGEFEVTD